MLPSHQKHSATSDNLKMSRGSLKIFTPLYFLHYIRQLTNIVVTDVIIISFIFRKTTFLICFVHFFFASVISNIVLIMEQCPGYRYRDWNSSIVTTVVDLGMVSSLRVSHTDLRLSSVNQRQGRVSWEWKGTGSKGWLWGNATRRASLASR